MKNKEYLYIALAGIGVFMTYQAVQGAPAPPPTPAPAPGGGIPVGQGTAAPCNTETGCGVSPLVTTQYQSITSLVGL